MTSIKTIRSNQKKNLNAINKAFEGNEQNQNAQEDDRFWKLTVDDEGKGNAVIRFLPSKDEEHTPWAKLLRYYFCSDLDRWYTEYSPQSIRKPCPVYELNGKDYKNGNEDAARARKMNTNYISSIYIVKDPGNPKNEGKVFLFKYGKSIFGMLEEKIKPEFEGDEQFNPFDLFEGANLNLRCVQNKKNFRDYSVSKFAKQGPLGDDKTIEKVYDEIYDLDEYRSPDFFRPYDELKEKLDWVLGNEDAPPSKPQVKEESKPKSNPAKETIEDDDEELDEGVDFGKYADDDEE